ncbi:DUF7715 family protein [Glaciibacter superstes]|uniref:DUF7715 family protein n=1 Tax=Glaciibacter superstes TaxID=501023 RepID=UPI0003B54ECF
MQERCARDRRDPANECGCSRGFAGLSSARPTTTARTAEFPDLTLDRYVTAIGDGLDAQGWGRQDADSLAALMVDIARQWPAGTVIERSFWEFSVREMERSGR